MKHDKNQREYENLETQSEVREENTAFEKTRKGRREKMGHEDFREVTAEFGLPTLMQMVQIYGKLLDTKIKYQIFRSLSPFHVRVQSRVSPDNSENTHTEYVVS